MLTINIRNLGDNKKLDYHTWAGRTIAFDRDYATVMDNFGNTYKRISFGGTPVGQVQSESIYPSKSIGDVLVFEPPIEKAQYLNLELPATNFGGEGMLRLRVPSSMIKRAD